MLAALDDELRADIRAFLQEVRSGEGGFQANTRIPFADGLSTFTGSSPHRTSASTGCSIHRASDDFIRALELPDGGFKGASWDQAADVEYTFYALGTLGLMGVGGGIGGTP